MKKIILGCAAVLLSLGLLAGCNNKEDEPPIEEAVVITVDSSASVVVGESLSLTYTVSPEKAEVIAASDNEDVVTAVAQEGTLYLEGVAEGSAIVTLVGTYEGYASANKNINVSVITKGEEDTEPEPQVPALSLSVSSTLSLEIPEEDDPTPTKIEYTVLPEEAEAKVTMEVTSGAEHVTLYSPEEAVEAELEEAWYVEPVSAGTSEITVSATAEGYTSAEETIVVTITEEGDDDGTVSQHTDHKINFFFVDNVSTPGTYYEIPSYADGYLSGYFTSSEYTGYTIDGSTKLTANGEQASDGYYVTLDLVDTGTIWVNIYFEHNGTGLHSAATGPTWSPEHRVFEDDNGAIVIDSSAEADHSDVYLAYNPSEHILNEAASEYALVGDFDDSDWNASPDKASKYYYEQSGDPWTIEVTMAAETNPAHTYNPSFYVVEYGQWDNVCGYDNLTGDTSCVQGKESQHNGIEVSWGASYTIVVDMNANPATISVTAKS